MDFNNHVTKQNSIIISFPACEFIVYKISINEFAPVFNNLEKPKK